MAQQVQLRRGTTAKHAAFTGAAGEVTVDTDKGTVVIHNGSTAGGFPALRENGSQNLVTTGTVTGASLSPTSSTVPTNGIYLPDANSVGISTDGSGRLFVDASGNVGVGAAPSTAFHVTRSAADAAIRVDGGTSNTSFIDFRIAGSNKSYVGLGGLTGGSNDDLINYNSSAGNWIAYTNATERLRITSTGALNFKGAGSAGSTQAVSFNGSAPVNSLVIDSSGRLGVGTSAPANTLTVQANDLFNQDTSGQIVIRGSSNTAKNLRIGFDTTSNYAYLQSIEVGTAARPLILQPFAGSVGIGSSTVAGRLQVGTTLEIDNNALVFNRGIKPSITASQTAILCEHNGIGNAECLTFMSDAGYKFLDDTGVSEFARIDTSGRLLVGVSGTSDPQKFTLADGNVALYTSSYNVGETINKTITSYAKNGVYSTLFDKDAEICFGKVDGFDVDYTHGGFISFKTTANNRDVAPAERVRIDASGGFRVKGAGTAGVSDAFFINGSAPASSAQLDSSGRLLVGTSTSRAVSDWSGNGPHGLIQIETANSEAIMSIISAGTGDAQRAGTISLGRHRNSTVGGTPTVVQNGDAL
ncbi:MAG: hypothetical protein FJ211_10395, partial [Ignavibacteria bacterium]|nr:hypothetical protein [Ignavibacteria bacterium]